MYVIQKKTTCDHCGGAGTFYEEDPDLPTSYTTYPCPRCVNGVVVRDMNADDWLLERLHKLKINRKIPTDFGVRDYFDWPLRDSELETETD